MLSANSICNLCKNKNICILYKEYNDVIVVSECINHIHHDSITKQNKNSFNRQQIVTALNNKQKRIKTINENTIACEQCNDSCSLGDIQQCCVCGKKLCLNCAIIDATTQRTFCEKCFDKE